MKKLMLLFLLVFSISVAFSQEQKKPKIGLVLSGGGAKGLAHIGVLKVLEEQGIEISYIGGTSMGAIIGGLYSVGYSSSQIDSIFKTTDYDALIQDFVPRSTKNFYEKRNDEVYALALPFRKLRIGIPRALSKGLYNFNLISKLTHDVRHIRDFNKLPIPFLCIATDIETGDQVLLNKGSLPQAIIASAAFPSLYMPVEIDGKLLIDGGVVNNYPIEEVKKMGADIIIGVDVQDGFKDRKALNDATRILVQITNMQMIKKMPENIKNTDIYIKPDIDGFNVVSFDQGTEIIKRGEEAAQQAIEQLKVLSKDYKKSERATLKIKKDSITITGIRTPQLENYTRSYVVGKLGFKAGTKISYEDLDKGINTLSATQNFSSIGYSFEKAENGDDILDIDLIENRVKTYLKFGLHYDGLYKSAVLLNATQKKMFFKNDVISLDVGLGDNFRYYLDYYLDNGFRWSFGVKSRFNSFNKNILTDFNDGEFLDLFGLNSINIDYSDFSNQVYFQTIFAQKFLIGVGAEYKHLRIKTKTLESTNTNPILENSDYVSGVAYAKYDSFDKKYFPREGILFTGDFQSFLYSSDYSRDFERFSILKGELAYATTFFNHLTVMVQSEAGFTIGEQTVPFFDFILGGYGYNMVNNFRHFYGYDFVSLSGNSYIKGAINLNYEIFRKNHVNFTANYANVGYKLFDSDAWIEQPQYSGYALGYGLETIIGPVELKHSWSPETGNHYTWFSLGFWF
ncbi:patatin-like phospholipase family protein [Flavobacterium macacae]|uniref:Patatin n=1 Tax=Flavobacterium macacae TaxID=2488993 RepID=A0A3P3W460_9FLAO|nr:patatin-like phospholipase family protein [Flavobacterium macacae]RRJ89750.1 patatin [Flavobacterium macacae]